MGYFDDVPKKGEKTSTTSRTSSASGYFDDIPTPEKKPGFFKSVAAGLVKLPARYATNVVQAYQIVADKPLTEPFSGDFLGRVAPVGTGDTFRQQVGDAIGAGVELASYIPVARGAKAGYESVKQGGKFLVKELAKEGAVGGFLSSAGSQIQDQAVEGRDVSGTDMVKATVIGTILNPLIGVGARKISELMGNKAPKVIDVESRSVDTNIPVRTPKSKYAEYRKSQGYEPYIKNEELPVIEMGPRGADESNLPVIRADAPTVRNRKVAGDFTFEPIKESQTTLPQAEKIMTSIIRGGKQSPELRTQVRAEAPRFEPKQPILEGETITPKLAQKVEADAVETGLISRFEGLPESKTMNMRQQAEQSAELVNTNYEKAKRVAMGQENPPGDLRDASVFEAVKQRAIREGDVATLKQLATESTIPSKLTAYGQEIKAADRLVDSNDPVELMQTVIKSREKSPKVKARGSKTKDVADVKESIKKNAPKKEDWSEFINSIEC